MSREDTSDIFNILVASDIHLGYNEADAIRGDDSFVTFEEILQYAVEYEVDFVLLGGDLFHDAKPSPNCLLRCTSLLRKYCFGDRPVSIEILSDQRENFKDSASGSVNYEDPNLNVSCPIFSIHGNHDDPIGRSAVSSLDILSRMGLVNYIGKRTSYSDVTVSPVLMKKGKTKVALYGLSYLKEQRLARLFANGSVKIEKVSSDDEWFNILTLHQNRADRGYLNYIPEDVLPDFMDLIIWGHEHDCRIKEEWNPVKSFHVIQPGSPVATSLAAGEALPKHCGLLKIYEKGFKMIPIKLRTVRPFVFDVIVLSEELKHPSTVDEHEIVQDFLKERVNRALMDADAMRSGHADQPKLPLIRLSVLYERESQQFNVIRFGQQFSDRIANPQDLVLLKREKIKSAKTEKTNVDLDALGDLVSGVESDEISVESLLERYFKEQPDENKLSMLSVKYLGEAVKSFTQKNYVEAFSEVILYQKNEYLKHLMQTDATTSDQIIEEILNFKESNFSESNGIEGTGIKQILDAATPRQASNVSNDSDDDGDDDDVVEVAAASKSNKSPRGRGRGRGRPRGNSSRSKSPPPVAAVNVATRGRGRGSRARGSRGSSKAANTSMGSLNISYEKSNATPNANSKNWLSSLSQKMSTRQSNASKAKVMYIEDSDD